MKFFSSLEVVAFKTLGWLNTATTLLRCSQKNLLLIYLGPKKFLSFLANLKLFRLEIQYSDLH